MPLFQILTPSLVLGEDAVRLCVLVPVKAVADRDDDTETDLAAEASDVENEDKRQ